VKARRWSTSRPISRTSNRTKQQHHLCPTGGWGSQRVPLTTFAQLRLAALWPQPPFSFLDGADCGRRYAFRAPFHEDPPMIRQVPGSSRRLRTPLTATNPNRKPPVERTSAIWFHSQCKVCGRRLLIRLSLLGHRVGCPHCGHCFTAMEPRSDTTDSSPETVLDRANRLLARLEAAAHAKRRAQQHLEDRFHKPRGAA